LWHFAFAFAFALYYYYVEICCCFDLNYFLLQWERSGKCISARADPNITHVPFRDSKLTRLLQESLGGRQIFMQLLILSMRFFFLVVFLKNLTLVPSSHGGSVCNPREKKFNRNPAQCDDVAVQTHTGENWGLILFLILFFCYKIGNAKTSLVINIAPCSEYLQESLSSLHFGSRVCSTLSLSHPKATAHHDFVTK
jgi:hypothetical protein